MDLVVLADLFVEVDRVALQPFGGEARAGDRGSAAEGFKLRVHDRIILHLNLELHDVAALRSSDHASADSFLTLLEAPHVAGVIEMIDDFVTVGHGSLPKFI